MARFTELLKKQLSGNISGAETRELMVLAEADEELKAIYDAVCASHSADLDEGRRQDGLEAYERHLKRMQKLDFLTDK